jgi:putative SOS response-associated peptidase YedK
MCSRIIQSSEPLRLAIVEGLDVSDSRIGNVRPRYNGAPSQELLVIRENHKTGERSLDLLRWGLIPHWCQDPTDGRRPINAKAESVSTLPTFRDAYAQRRCIVPVDGFFEWRARKGARAKQPYAIAMKDGSPFGLAGVWENWRNLTTGEWERTFAIITVPSNELVRQIHDRMPAILKLESYDRWLGPELDPQDLLITYPPKPMTMWPISTRVNTPENDDPSLLDQVDKDALDQKDLTRVSAV